VVWGSLEKERRVGSYQLSDTKFLQIRSEFLWLYRGHPPVSPIFHAKNSVTALAMLQFDSRWRNGWRNFSTMQVYSTTLHITESPL
jgi:hypothetical protein